MSSKFPSIIPFSHSRLIKPSGNDTESSVGLSRTACHLQDIRLVWRTPFSPPSKPASPPPSLVPPPQHRIPTVHESAIMAWRILHLTPFGTLSTIFPHSPSTHETRPATVQGTPITLVGYITDCEPVSGNPTLLALNIATSFKNAAAGSRAKY
ncbi:hypothetical protein B0H13DRAFT_2372122 [Mycena leptocephala]|nr:hypothetical protein B0H13DRAFT_2372122 [Mycena leptocephala]